MDLDDGLKEKGKLRGSNEGKGERGGGEEERDKEGKRRKR